MPDTAQSIPLFGFGTGTRSVNVSAQMRENLYVEKLADPDKTQLALFPRPGLTRFSQLQGVTPGIIMDLQSPIGEFLFIPQSGTNLVWFLSSAISGTPTPNQILGSGGASAVIGNVVRSANDGNNAVWRDGNNGYITAANFVTQIINATNYPNAVAFPSTCASVAYCASRFVCDDPSSPGQFRWSAAGDPTSWAALDFATAESNPDPLSCVFEAHGQLLLFGAQTIEFWAPAAAGASGQQPFVRVGGANIQWGTTAVDTVRKCNDSVIFVGRNQGGNRQVVQLSGYEARVISTPDIELQIQNDPRSDNATALFFVANGHPFYVLNLSNESWAYDLSSGAWSKFTTDGGRFAAQWQVLGFGGIIVSDYRDGRLYVIDPNVYTDDGNQIVREVVSKHAFANLARLSLRELRIDCETGVGLNSGQGSNPQCMLQWSKDGGHVWGNEVWQTLGPIGSYLTCAVWRMLGRARDWIFKLRVTDPVKVVIIGAAAKFDP